MRIRMLLPVAAAALIAGCTLPPHIAESMTDFKLCDVHKFTWLYGFADDDNTRDVVNAERARRDQPECPAAG